MRTGTYVSESAPAPARPTVAEMPYTLDFLPPPRYAGHMLRNVAVLALDEVAAFELGVLCEVFGTDRTADGFPAYHFARLHARRRAGAYLGPASTSPRRADLGPVETPTWSPSRPTPDDAVSPRPVLDALRRADARGAYVMSVCSGAFVLGEAGLLDGRECTTHWRYADELAPRFPRAKVQLQLALRRRTATCSPAPAPPPASTPCLHLVRQEHGSAIATKLARRMVVPAAPRRRPGAVHRGADPAHARTRPRWSRC